VALAANNPNPGSDTASVLLYDSSGNLLPLQHPNQNPTTIMRTLQTGQIYIVAVTVNGNAGDPYTLNFSEDQIGGAGETVEPAIALDPHTGQSTVVTDSFATPRSVNFYPLNTLNGGASGTVTITPTGLGTTPFAMVFRRLRSSDPWELISPPPSSSGASAFTVPLIAPPNQDLTDAQYLLGVAPQNLDTAARAYTLSFRAPVLGPASVSSPATDLLTPPPTAVGTAQVQVPSGTLSAGGQQLYRFRAHSDGTATINLQTAAFEPLLSVYDSTGTTLLGVASYTVPGQTATLAVQVQAGSTYLVRVGDVPDQNGGTFSLTIATPYTPAALALNSLAADPSISNLRSSVTTTTVNVGPAQGAMFYRLNLDPATQILVLGRAKIPLCPRWCCSVPTWLPSPRRSATARSSSHWTSRITRGRSTYSWRGRAAAIRPRCRSARCNCRLCSLKMCCCRSIYRWLCSPMRPASSP
jgi:hypothetical protein